jgi:hypothetical protein
LRTYADLCTSTFSPLAVPVSDCSVYVNLTAGGLSNSNPTTVTSFATRLATPSATGGPTSPTAATVSKSPDKLSTGGIAGVAIGGAAVLLVAVIALIYFRRKRRAHPVAAPDPTPAAAWDQQDYGGSTIHPSSTYSPKNPHESYYSTGQAPSEMGTSRYQNLTNASSPVASPEPTAHQGYRPHSGHPSEAWSPPPVEMDSTRGQTPAPQNAAWQDSQWSREGTPAQDQEQYGQQHWGGMNR